MSAGQYGHAGRHHGIGTPDCPRELHHHHDARCEAPTARYERARHDRKQRAREAGHGAAPHSALNGSRVAAIMIDAAVETAMRVKITRDIVEAAELADVDTEAAYLNVITAAFAAAGFEIEE